MSYWEGWQEAQLDVVQLPTGPFCPYCFAQAVIFDPVDNGEALIPTPCPWCQGLGSILP